MKRRRPRKVTVPLKDVHIIKAHKDFIKLLEPINKDLRQKGLIWGETNNGLATKILADNIRRKTRTKKMKVDVRLRGLIL